MNNQKNIITKTATYFPETITILNSRTQFIYETQLQVCVGVFYSKFSILIVELANSNAIVFY